VRGQLKVLLLDLSSLASVRKFAEEFSAVENKLHILVNNAGFAFQNKKITEDGFEQVNF
jgi:retinol dehydrogenase 14